MKGNPMKYLTGCAEASNICLVLLTLMEYLPAIAAMASIIWISVRVFSFFRFEYPNKKREEKEATSLIIKPNKRRKND